MKTPLKDLQTVTSRPLRAITLIKSYQATPPPTTSITEGDEESFFANLLLTWSEGKEYQIRKNQVLQITNWTASWKKLFRKSKCIILLLCVCFRICTLLLGLPFLYSHFLLPPQFPWRMMHYSQGKWESRRRSQEYGKKIMFSLRESKGVFAWWHGKEERAVGERNTIIHNISSRTT